MKAKIEITGQVNGNHVLYNAICGGYERREIMFYNKIIYYQTLKEARKELWEAYKYLRKEKTVEYAKQHYLAYDASIARIVTDKY